MNEGGDSTDPFVEMVHKGAPGLTTLRLYKSTWDDHISLHTEVPQTLTHEEFVSSVEAADQVFESATNPKSVVLVNSAVRYQEHPLMVTAKLIEGTTSGRISTALFTDRPKVGRKLWSVDDEE